VKKPSSDELGFFV